MQFLIKVLSKLNIFSGSDFTQIAFVFRQNLSDMGVLAGIYNGLFKRTSTFTLCICVGALGVRF